MTDYFEVLEVPRRPWLDPEALRLIFLQKSALVHPDRVHGASAEQQQKAQEQYTILNAAYQALRDPKGRLLHLLALEQGKPPPEVMAIPHETTDLFLEVAGLCQKLDPFLALGQDVTSPLLKVRRFEESQAWVDRIRLVQGKIQEWRARLEWDLKDLNRHWEDSLPTDPAPAESRRLPLARLEQLYQLFSYTSRWSDQLQDRMIRLMG